MQATSAVGKQRTRFFATMPRVLDQWNAELYRYALGGRFPRWNDDRVVTDVLRYAELCAAVEKHSAKDIRDRTPTVLRRLAKSETDVRIARRLLAIANALSGMSRTVAEIGRAHV